MQDLLKFYTISQFAQKAFRRVSLAKAGAQHDGKLTLVYTVFSTDTRKEPPRSKAA